MFNGELLLGVLQGGIPPLISTSAPMISINVDLPRNPTTMSISFSGTEACSCSDGSPSQLLRAIKQKLEDITLGGGYVLSVVTLSRISERWHLQNFDRYQPV